MLALLGGILVLSVLFGSAVADIQHEHPDNVSDDDDLEAVGGWLGDRMGDVHADCSEGISLGNFDACEDLDDEYESLLERYVTVERETVDDEEDEAAETLNETREKQRELAELFEEFNTTLEAYDEARADGDDEEARELVRELRRLADRIEELGGEIEIAFRELDRFTTADLNVSADATRASTDEAISVTTEIEQETFDPTVVSAEIDPVASFAEPATVTGKVTDENGTAVTDGVVVVESTWSERTANISADGSYEVPYRPVLEPLGNTTLDVRYVPDADSEFLGTATTVSTTVERTNSTVELRNATDEAMFNESVAVEGVIRVDGEPVESVPVVINVDGERLATTETDDDGSFETSGRLPAAVSTGEATIEIRASEDGLATGVSRTERTLSVAETPTELTVETEATEDGVNVTGQLQTEDEASVANQELVVTVDGTERFITTDDDGAYELSVEHADEERAVVVAYDDPRTNLGSSETSTTLPAEPTGTSAAEAILSSVLENPILATIVVLGSLVIAVVFGLYAYRQRRNRNPPETTVPNAVTATANEPNEKQTDRPTAGAAAVLEAARANLAESPDSAIKTGYSAIRRTISDEKEVGSRTHWEFYHEVGSELDAGRRDALRSVTEAFEAAAFAAGSVETERAAAALDDAERCLGVTDGGASRPNSSSVDQTD